HDGSTVCAPERTRSNGGHRRGRPGLSGSRPGAAPHAPSRPSYPLTPHRSTVALSGFSALRTPITQRSSPGDGPFPPGRPVPPGNGPLWHRYREPGTPLTEGTSMAMTSTTRRPVARQVSVSVSFVLMVMGSVIGVGALGGTPISEAAGGLLSTDATYVAPASAAFTLWTEGRPRAMPGTTRRPGAGQVSVGVPSVLRVMGRWTGVGALGGPPISEAAGGLPTPVPTYAAPPPPPSPCGRSSTRAWAPT